VLKLQMHAESRTQVRAAMGDHVDASYRRDRLDMFQPVCVTCSCCAIPVAAMLAFR